MKKILLRTISSFCYSVACGLLVNFLVEIIVQHITGDLTFSPVSPEFLARFSSRTVAIEVNALLYGLIGASYSASMVIYETDRIGFIIQNIIYFLVTSLVWVPILTFMWQLQRYPQALISTIFCYAITYVIVFIIGYRITKRDVANINQALKEQEQNHKTV